MKSKNLSESDFERAKEQYENVKKLFEKGISLKSEFEMLQYPEKLKFMDKYFSGASAAGEDPDPRKPIISVFPNEKEPDGKTPNNNYRDEIRLYNEWKIKLFESLDPAFSVEFSFERLKKRFEDHISDIKKMDNPHPEKAINDYIQDQISIYKEKARSRDVQLQWKEFGGAWDITKRAINFGPFLKARAYYNYISFLEYKLQNIKPIKKISKESIPLHILETTYSEFNNGLWKSISRKQFIDTFGTENQNIKKLDAKKRGNQILIAYLFKEICQNKLGIPFTGYLKPRVGKLDGANQLMRERKPRNKQMFDKINEFLGEMTGNQNKTKGGQ